MLLNRLVWFIITISLCFLAIAPAVDPGRVGAEETLRSISTAPMDINQQTASITLSRDTALANQVLSISGSGFSGLGAGLNRCIEQGRVLINNVPVEIIELEEAGQCDGGVGLTDSGTVDVDTLADGVPVATDTTTRNVPEAEITVTPNRAAVGESITLTGLGFNPFDTVVRIELGGLDLLGTREESIDQDGRINIADLTVPGLDIGTHSLVMSMESGISIATTITVVPTQSGPASCANDGAVTDVANNPGLVSDCAVLLASRDTLAGSATLNWSADLAVEDWDGVTVGGSPRRVTKLILFRKQLTGEIPAELGGLTNLQTLDLHGNRLPGEIPGELGGLVNMQTLWLSVNQLTGEIPGELGTWSTCKLCGFLSTS